MNTDQSVAETYIAYLKESSCSDTLFVFHASGCTIYQPIDDEEESKYVIHSDHCDVGVWNEFYALAMKHKNAQFV